MERSKHESEGNLPKANLSPTANPLIFLDKETGEIYFLENSSGHDSRTGPYLRKLNDRKE